MNDPVAEALDVSTAPVRDRLRAALAATDVDQAGASACEALAAVGYPTWASRADGSLPLPSALTAAQRAVATALAWCAVQGVHAYALPVSAWARQHWLGLARGAALDEETSLDVGGVKLCGPRWSVYNRARRAGFVCGSELRGAEQLRVVAESKLVAFGFSSNVLLAPLVTEHASQVLPWALALAQELAAPLHRKDQGRLHADLRMALCGSFVAGRVVIDAALEHCFTLTAPTPEAALAHVRAVPEARREAVLLEEIAEGITIDALTKASVVLEDFPLPSVAKLAAERFSAQFELRKRSIGAKLHPAVQAREDAVIERLCKVSERHPSLREPLAPVLALKRSGAKRTRANKSGE